MTTKAITLYEDNAGGLHMTDGALVVSGLEFVRDNDGMAATDMAEWDEWAVQQGEPYPYDASNNYGKIIAIYSDGELETYPDKMGTNARLYFGLPDER